MFPTQREHAVNSGLIVWTEEVLGGARSHSLPPLKKRPQAGANFGEEREASARDRRLPKLGRPPAVTAQFGGSNGGAERSELWQAFVGSKSTVFADRIADAQAHSRSIASAGSGVPSPPATAGRSTRPQRDKGRRTPRGITATQTEARGAYNSIDFDIVSSIEARIERLVERCEQVPLEEATGVYVLIERCHSCEQHHKLTTRHREDHYATLAQDVLKYIRNSAQGTIMEVGEMLCQLDATPRRLGSSYAHGLEIWHTASRVGAFEVYLLAPNLKLQDTDGTIVQFPAKCVELCERTGSPSKGSSSWGAQLVLERCGYVATLLHSKLSSKSWPTVQQITQRLFTSLPLAVIYVRVLCPSGQGMPHFTVEVIESGKSQLPQLRHSQEDPVHMVVQATQGSCQIQSVPLHTPMELRIYHSTMRVQSVSFVASRLRMIFAFGADICFRLWVVEVPGGLSVNATVDHIQASRLPENAQPFDGHVEVDSGEVVPVKARLQIPWDSFRAGQQSPAMAFTMLRRLYVNGYHPSELELHMQACTVNHLYQQECLEIAVLAAPEVCLTVVLPGSRQPVANVRVEITAEQQRAVTNERGQCWVILRTGQHKARLMHEDFTAEWVEQELVVDCMEPKLQVPLPVKLKIWRAPVTVCEEMCAYDLWVSSAGNQPLPSWSPFTGELSVAGCEKLQIQDGILCAAREPVEVIDDMSSLRPPSRDVLSKLSPLAPFSYRIDTGTQSYGFQNMANFLTSHLYSGPLHLGMCLRESPSTEPKAPAALVVRSMASCCGHPVAGIKVDIDDGEQTGIVQKDGLWEVVELAPGEHKVVVTHAAFPGGTQQHTVCLAKPDGRPELPLLFDSCICLFAVEGPGGRRLVQAAGSSYMIPAGAMAFKGKVKTDAGEMHCTPNMEGGRHQPLCVQIEANHSKVGTRCPISSLTVIPEMPNYQWQPNFPPALSSSRCGLCDLIQKGPITLGSLRPLAVAAHIDGREFVLPIEEFSTIGHVTAHLVEVLNLGKDAPLNLVSEDSDGGAALPMDEVVRIGQRLCTLVRLETRVVFGTSDIGIPGATVVLDGRHLTHMKRTDEDGRCEFGISAGSHTVTASHPMLGGVQTISMSLDSLFSSKTIFSQARVTVYASPVSALDDAAAVTVWVCTQPGHIPPGARPVAGKMTVRQDGVLAKSGRQLAARTWERELDTLSVTPLDLDMTPGKKQNAGDNCQPQSLPAGGLSFECSMGDHLWIPDGQPWLLQDAESWKALLDAPLRVGILRPPVNIRYRGNAEDWLNLRLPADENDTAIKVCAAVAQRFNLDASDLATYCEGIKLAPNDPIKACSVIDVWPLAQLRISVCTRCCSRGVGGVSVSITEAGSQDTHDLSSALFGAIAENHAGYTDEQGMIEMTTHLGEHVVYLMHQAIFDPTMRVQPMQDAHAQMMVTAAQESQDESYFIDPKLFVYAVCSAGFEDAEPDERLLEVWICARPTDIPEFALPIAGVLRFSSDNGPVVVALGAHPGDPVVLPDSCGNLNPSSPCPLLGLSIDIDVLAGQLWCPEDPSPLSDWKGECAHMQLLSKPLYLGSVKPVVTVHCDMGQTIYVPLQECHVVESVRSWVAKELGTPLADVGIFNVDGEMEDDGFEIFPGQELYAGLLAELEIVVLVPEAADGDQNSHGLEGVSVDVAGHCMSVGATNEKGICRLRVRSGSQDVRLHHPCFGKQGRVLRDVPAVHGQANRRVVLADVRVYIFASKADVEENDLSAGSPSRRAQLENSADLLGPLLVWICSNASQIQGDMVSISGRVWARGLRGREVSAQLDEGATELMLCNGEEAEAEIGETARCTLSSLSLDVARAGYCFRQRDPPPLVERAAEIGGCEYLRLLACPTVVGYLDPAFCVENLDGVLMHLPVKEDSTVSKVKEDLQEALENAIPVNEMALCLDGAPLDDAVQVQPGWRLTIMETAAVQIRVVTGCCCEPFDGVGIFVDDQPRGRTDAHGRIDEIILTNGQHKLRLEHVILGKHGSSTQEISVARGKANLFTILPDTRLFVYATDPDLEEYEDNEFDGADEEPMPELNSALDSSCVWLAADPGHVPDDAVPLQGCVVCETAAGTQVSAMLSPKDTVPVQMRLTAHMPSLIEPRHCKLASLKLECARRGHCWLPKNPSPLQERLQEIGGCEFLRVLACPVSLGLLKPAVIVQCAGGLRLVLPISMYSNISELREHVSQQLGTTDVESLAFETLEGVPFAEGALQAPRSSVGSSPLCLLCSHGGKSIEQAREENERAEAAEAEAAKDAEAAVAARAEREASQSLEVLEASTRETSWLADLSASMRDS